MSSHEIWKDIPDYAGFYAVSNLGRVKSIARTIVNKSGVTQQYKARLLSPGLNSRGYLTVCLSKDGRKRTYKVHYLVICAFVRCPNLDEHIHHKDKNRHNNKLLNLEIMDFEEHMSLHCAQYAWNVS